MLPLSPFILAREKQIFFDLAFFYFSWTGFLSEKMKGRLLSFFAPPSRWNKGFFLFL